MIQLREQFGLSSFYQELIVSITLGSAALASLGSAALNDWLGRKPVILMSSFIFTVGAVALGVAYSKAFLLIGRLIVGFGIGMASMTVPVYIAEISPNHLRGALVTVNTVCITAGQMIAAIVDGLFMFDPRNGWRYMLSLGGVPSLIQFCGFLAMPETPRWLAQHGRFEAALNVLTRIHGEKETTPEVEREFNEIVGASIDSLGSSNPQDQLYTHQTCSTFLDNRPLVITDRGQSFWDRLTLVRMVRYPHTRRSLLVGCGLQLFQQLVGINTVMYYSASILSMAGVGSSLNGRDQDSTVVWMAAAVASTNFLFCLSSPWLISRLRRRTLLMLSLSGVLVSLLVLGASFQLISSTSAPVTVVEPAPMKFSTNNCYKASTCDSCMRTLSCGFCYNIQNGNAINGSCLPTSKEFSKLSIYGRCSNSSFTEHDVLFATDHCPTSYGWITMAGLILYLASFAPGMASLPWTINSELYPTWARSTGVACSTGVNWFSNILVSLTFLSLADAITRQGAYFLYAGVTVLAILFVYNCVPETGNISLEETNRALNSNGDEG